MATDNASAHFRFTDSKSLFVIELSEPKTIAHARRVLQGVERERIHVRGQIVKEPVWYNAEWDYHLEPATIDFFRDAIEVCDATIAYVQEHLSEVGGSTLPGGHWCPWTSHLVDEVYVGTANRDEVPPDEDSPPLCAYLRDGGRCGYHSSGSEKYVVNRERRRAVAATVRKSWSTPDGERHLDAVYQLPAGGESYVGCTVSAFSPPRDFEYRVIGCRVLPAALINSEQHRFTLFTLANHNGVEVTVTLEAPLEKVRAKAVVPPGGIISIAPNANEVQHARVTVVAASHEDYPDVQTFDVSAVGRSSELYIETLDVSSVIGSLHGTLQVTY